MIFQEWIVRADLRANPDRLYLFGDNERREGLGGQAREMRGEPNALGIATKRAPSMQPWALWTDADFKRCAAIIDRDVVRALEHAAAGGIVVCPKAGLGTDRAKLPTNAPRIYQYLRAWLVEIHRLSK